jgi:hypothetical protein
MSATADSLGDRKRLLRSLLLFAASIATLGTTLTAAMFGDSASVTGNAFATGTLDLSTAPTSAAVTYSNMAPGDVVADDVTVTNDGSLQLRYAVTSTTTGDATLAAQLDLTVWAEAAEGDGDVTCAATAPGTVLYGPGDLGSAGTMNLVGSPTTGSQAGDRTLDAAAGEVLCFRVELPLASDNSYQGLTTTATFDFLAEQTKNNP